MGRVFRVGSAYPMDIEAKFGPIRWLGVQDQNFLTPFLAQQSSARKTLDRAQKLILTLMLIPTLHTNGRIPNRIRTHNTCS